MLTLWGPKILVRDTKKKIVRAKDDGIHLFPRKFIAKMSRKQPRNSLV